MMCDLLDDLDAGLPSRLRRNVFDKIRSKVWVRANERSKVGVVRIFALISLGAPPNDIARRLMPFVAWSFPSSSMKGFSASSVLAGLGRLPNRIS